MSNFEDYRFADVKNCCEDDIIRLENLIKNRSNKDVILIAYEKK